MEIILPTQMRQYIETAVAEGRYESIEDFVIESVSYLIAVESGLFLPEENPGLEE